MTTYDRQCRERIERNERIALGMYTGDKADAADRRAVVRDIITGGLWAAAIFGAIHAALFCF